MAVRDRNLFAWQAYVITMSFVSVGLLVGMFFLWSSYSALSKRFEDQQTQLSNTRDQFTQSDQRVERLLAMMGYGEYTPDDMKQMAEQFATDERLAPVEQDYAEAMRLFPPDHPENEKNLIKLPKFLIDTIRVRNRDIVDARAVTTDLQKQLEDTIATETAARQKAVEEKLAAEKDLAEARQQHTAAIARLNSEKEDAIKQFQTYQASVEREKQALRDDKERLAEVNTQQLQTIQEQADIIQGYRNPDFAAPQGEIVKVYNGGRVVWIDLGSEDGLRAGVPFSVIDESAVNISEADPKAQLVVTRIVGEHLCQAELTEPSNYRNPVVTGDKVYSPAWRPGRKVGFALVGMMDLNRDRQDDAEQVRELIQRSGGVIDEEMDTNGTTKGPGMTPNTSFLVLGTDLTLPENASPELQAQQKAKIATYAKFITKARQNGIIQISLDKLMGYLKTEGADRTIPLGSRIQASDFPVRGQQNPPVSNTKVSDIYYKRSAQ